VEQRPTASRSRARRRRARALVAATRPHRALIALAILAVGFLAAGAVEAWRDSPTFDEPVYVAAGLAGLEHRDLALNDEHPPLVKVLAALPVLLVDPIVPANGSWSDNDEQTYSAAFLSAQLRAGKIRAVDFASRIVPLLAAAGLAFVLFGFANELYGGDAGLLSGALWLASPLVLGLGHLDGVDVPFALAASLFGWALLRWIRRRGRRGLLALAAAGGLAGLADASGLILIAIGALSVVGYEWRAGRGLASVRAAVVVAGGLLAIWAVYAVLDPGVIVHPGLLPRPYLDGIGYLRTHDTTPAASYLDGTAWVGGRWWYWPVSLAVKLPPATLAVLLLGPLGLLGVDRARRREVAIVAGLPAAVLFAFTLTLPRDIGVRYLMPVIALWLVVAAAAASRRRSSRLLGAALLLSGALGVASVIASMPDSLAWTSPAFAAPYRVATNSSVDWGQDLFLLQRWSAGHHARVAYFGPRGVTLRDIASARPLLGVPLAQVTGWVAVSATDLTTDPQLAWVRAYCPVGNLGGTILLYRFAGPPSARPGPVEPAAPCRGSTSVRVN
jgi:4-amino-4-deoxy-L-arabinose transferase-like glycosyltransferase